MNQDINTNETDIFSEYANDPTSKPLPLDYQRESDRIIEEHRAKGTTAQVVSALLHDNGQTWTADDGRDLDRLARDLGAWHQHRDQLGTGCDVYTFDDDSRIIACEGGWDLGFTGCDCLCWQGAGHDDDCEWA